MRTPEEIEALRDKVQPYANDGHRAGEVMWDTLRWVTGATDDDPFEYHIGVET